MKSNYTGIYVGIVVQNNDTENRGRVKVFVPHVNAGVYEKWYNVKKNKSFRFVGKNINSDLSDIITDLKNILPWATQASPLGGQSSTGRYNAYNDAGSVSDTNTLNNFAAPSGYQPTQHSLNDTGIGEKPARKYEMDHMRLNDAFADSKLGGPDGAKRPNKYSYDYRPSSYSNCAKGVFGIPNVGAHVWCFFEDGDPQNPVYFAAAFGQQDWQGVFGNSTHDSPDYPGSYENVTYGDAESQNINVETYRNKFLINQKGGTLEFVNTDNREILKMTHYSGSFKEFNNHTTTELAAKNDQKLVLQDQYLTVQGYGGVYYGRDLDYIVQGDHFLRVGKQSDSLHRAWREKARELHHIKQLFETQRADKSADSANLPGAFVSPYQDLVGSNIAKCPVCNTSSTRADTYYDLNEVFTSCSINETKSTGETSDNHAKITAPYIEATARIGEQYVNAGKTVFAHPDDGKCPSCGGTGYIQGSMDGTYDLEPRKLAGDWLKEARRIIDQLADIESSLGRGGNEIHNIAKHKIETIGMVMNDFGSVRIDTQGKYYKNGVQVLPEGVINTRTVSPVVEYVHVDDLPGGSYTLNVCNRWNVQVGAGGVSMKSYGPVDIGGTIVNVGGTQVNIGSENEVNIDGGKRLNIVSDILTLRQRNNGQVLVDSNLGVTKNVVIGGGMHVEGELCVNHVTAPCEIQETEQTIVWSYLLNGLSFSAKLSGFADSKGHKINGTTGTIELTSDSNHDLVKSYAHSHHFKNLPLHLKNENKGVRDVSLNFHDAADREPPKDREFKNSQSKST